MKILSYLKFATYNVHCTGSWKELLPKLVFSCDHSEKFVLLENFNELRLRDNDFTWPLKQVKNAAIFHELSKITEEFLSWI